MPPSYTRAETRYLTPEAGERAGPIPLPTGSELTIRVTDYSGLPSLEAPGAEGTATFSSLGGALSEATIVLRSDGPVRVLAEGEPLASWRFALTPDAPPEIARNGAPGPTATRALEVPFSASDDYGVTAAWAEIEAATDPGTQGLVEEPITFALPLPIARAGTTVEDVAIRDLTEHPWAGARVRLRLHAEDGAGQTAATDSITITLPARIFTDPLAKALVEQRRNLALDLAEAARVLDILQAVTRQPEGVFAGNHGAYLATRTAIRRLASGIGAERVPGVAGEVVDLLWLAALSLEEGDVSDALERLRQAQERLRDALENGTDEEIAAAIEQLREAMREYLQALAEQMQTMDPSEMSEMDPNAQSLSQQDLEQMLDELQRQAESGLRDQAQQMLSQLQQMLENLQQGRMAQQQGQPGAQQSLERLQDLIQRQRELSDRTFDQLREQRRQGQQGQQGERGERGQRGQEGQQGRGQGQQPGSRQGGGRGQHGENGRLAAEQEALRQALRDLQQDLEGMGMQGPSGSMGEAGREMGEAREDLEGGRNSQAVTDQIEALDRLNESAQALEEEIRQGQGQAAAQGAREGEGRAQDDALDPFDRPSAAHGAIDGRSTSVPDRSAIDRARELMEELRRRAAEPDRPEIELDYFERLLDRF